jgi:NAD(P)-dependent dehydrogenase (short-subunit alcohol dehydrogenase family)
MKLFSLTARTAVVTGGYGHVGLGLTQGLLEAGAKVYIAGRSEEKFSVAKKRLAQTEKLDFLELDISRPESIALAAERLKKNGEMVSVLVNNAITPVAPSTEKNYKDWESSLSGGIISAVAVTDGFLSQLQASKNASVINISSMYGVVSPDFSIYEDPGCQKFKNQPFYGAAKAGLIQYTKYMAVSHAAAGIRFNCISPGPFPSEDVQKEKTFIKNLERKVPMKRIGKPIELAGACVFLASDASSYVTGQNLMVDGGWTAW